MIIPNFLKRARNMARSEPSDQTAFNDRDEEATWQREECPIAREISTVDLHLSGGGYVTKSGSPNVI